MITKYLIYDKLWTTLYPSVRLMWTDIFTNSTVTWKREAMTALAEENSPFARKAGSARGGGERQQLSVPARALFFRSKRRNFVDLLFQWPETKKRCWWTAGCPCVCSSTGMKSGDQAVTPLRLCFPPFPLYKPPLIYACSSPRDQGESLTSVCFPVGAMFCSWELRWLSCYNISFVCGRPLSSWFVSFFCFEK